MNSKETIQKALIEVLQQAALMILAVAIFWLDARQFDQTLSEYSVTENAQSALLLISFFVFTSAAISQPASRGFLALVAGFFLCLFIRESDAYLDRIVHGFWVYPAVAVAAATIFYAKRCTGTVAAPLAEFSTTKAFNYIIFGLLILMVFSRLFGTGSLWRLVMGPDYVYPYRDAIQEGIELLGYLFVAYGSLVFRFNQKASTGVAK